MNCDVDENGDNDGWVVVQKVLPKYAKDAEFVRQFVAEIKLMSDLNHPNIVLFLGAVISPVDETCLVLEYCALGSLFKHVESIREKKLELTMHQCLSFAIDIARGKSEGGCRTCFVDWRTHRCSLYSPEEESYSERPKKQKRVDRSGVECEDR